MSRVAAVKKIKGVIVYDSREPGMNYKETNRYHDTNILGDDQTEIVYEVEDQPSQRINNSTGKGTSSGGGSVTLEKPPVTSLIVVTFFLLWPVTAPLTIFAIVMLFKKYSYYALAGSIIAGYALYRYKKKLPLIPKFKQLKKGSKKK